MTNYKLNFSEEFSFFCVKDEHCVRPAVELTLWRQVYDVERGVKGTSHGSTLGNKIVKVNKGMWPPSRVVTNKLETLNACISLSCIVNCYIWNVDSNILLSLSMKMRTFQVIMLAQASSLILAPLPSGTLKLSESCVRFNQKENSSSLLCTRD